MLFVIVCIGYCVSDKKIPRPFNQTLTGYILPHSLTNTQSTRYKTCCEVHLQNGDKCEVGQFVIAKAPGQIGATAVARVEEILQVVGSVADYAQMPNHILLQAVDMHRMAATYLMPSLDLNNNWALVTFQVCTSFLLRHISY
jgi:hypothetical protein